MADAKQTEAEYFLPDEFLSDDFFTEGDEENPKASVMGAPPQLSPPGIGNWSFSSRGSPNGPSREPSPLSSPFAMPGNDALDLLYALERLNLNDENPSKSRNGLGCFYPNQELIKQQLQAARFYHLKRQQLLKMQQEHANAVWMRPRQTRAPTAANPVNPLRLSPSEWPPLQKQQSQQQPANGMTAVFLNGGGRKQSNGTGVFLPRRIGAPTEPKKQNCSTVLLPARVVQALNLNVEDMGVRRPRMSGCYAIDSNHALMGRSNLKRNRLHNRQAAVLGLAPEICLPQEWTY